MNHSLVTNAELASPHDGAPQEVHRLARLFGPRSIALVGATEKSIWTSFIARNFRDFGYSGRVFAVNRTGVDVLGFKGFASCRDIGEAIDVAFIFVPQPAVIGALEDAAAAGVRNAAILTSGYSETGAQGVALQAELVARASALGMNIWGPNSLGFNNVSARTPVSAIPAALPLLPPRIAIVSQSGATASELNELALSQNIGASFVAATGNEAQLSLADIVDYLVDHEPTRAIAVFAESIRDPVTFERAARRASERQKPIVILKIGRSELAAAVAKAHTGSLAGNDRVFGAICERLGVIRVHSPEDLIVTAGLLAATGPLPQPGLGFVSISGGACTLVADGAGAAGASLPSLPPETVAVLNGLIADFAISMNPLDVTGAAVRDPDLLERLIPVVAGAPEIGLIGINMGIPTTEDGATLPMALAAIGRAVATLDKPAVMVTTVFKTITDVTRKVIAEHGLPHIVCGIDPFLRAAGSAAWWSGKLAALSLPFLSSGGTAGEGRRAGLTSERAVLDYLASHSVPVIPATVATSRAEAERVAVEGPFALKILSSDIPHKTEVGGVRLNIDKSKCGAVYDEIRGAVAAARPDARIEGVIISPMRQGGIELLVGVTRDPTWGAMLTVGMGGIMVELLDDIAIAPLPVDSAGVLNLLGSLRGSKLLRGYRNAEPVDLGALAETIVRIGDAALALGPELESLEVNPLFVRGDHIEALDGLLIWKD